MNRVLEIDYANRIARVEAGITNLGISEAVQRARLLLRARPVEPARLHASPATSRMNSGGAHCLKYGVTTNNVLGVKHGADGRQIVEIGGAPSRRAGLRPAGLIVGSEGQLGIVTEATVRILRAAEGARPMLFGFDSQRGGRRVRRRHHRRRHHPGRHRVHGQARHPGLRGLRQGRLSARRRGAADHRGRGLRRGDGRPARRASSTIAQPLTTRRRCASAESREQSAAIWKGRKSAFGAIGRIADYYLHGRHHPARPAAARCCAASTRSCKRLRPAGRQRLPCRRRQPAPADPLRRQRPGRGRRRPRRPAPRSSSCASRSGGCLTGEHGVGIEKRDLMRVQFNADRPGPADADQDRVRPRWLLNPAKVFPLDGRRRRRDEAA